MKNAFERLKEALLAELQIIHVYEAIDEAPFMVSESITEERLYRAMPAAAPPLHEADASLAELLDQAKSAPSLGAFLRRKAHLRDMVTYRQALFEQGQISRDYWSRLLNDAMKASKEKLLRVAILLRLTVDEAEEMLDLAGYAFSPNNPRDVVVSFCLRMKHYDFVVIERLLEDHDIQSLFEEPRSGKMLK